MTTEIRSRLPEQHRDPVPGPDVLEVDVRRPWHDSWAVIAFFSGAALVIMGVCILLVNFELGPKSPKIDDAARWSFALKRMVDPDRGVHTTGFGVTTIVAGLVTLWITRTVMYRRKRRLVAHAKRLELETL